MTHPPPPQPPDDQPADDEPFRLDDRQDEPFDLSGPDTDTDGDAFAADGATAREAGGAPDPWAAYDEAPGPPEHLIAAFASSDAEPEPVDPAELARHHVLAVLVSHDGARWLPRTLAALGALDSPPETFVAVDTGSRDGSAALLVDALGAAAVVSLPASTGFGAAVAAGVEHGRVAGTAAPGPGAAEPGPTHWVWVLHDDVAPEPDALRRLLECAVRRPDAGLVGPKVRGWSGDRQLLEVGLSITAAGRRVTGLERREYDQGQHDRVREVLAVGSAGLLVRLDVWDELGGFDPLLQLFRDDVDLGWRANLAGHAVLVCPPAVVDHAEAAAHGRRRVGVSRERVHRMDRRNALHVLLANVPATRFPLVLVRLVLGSLLRAAGFLLGKLPALAAEELAALALVVGRPGRLWRARQARRPLRRTPWRRVRPLLPPPGHQLRHGIDAIAAVLSGTGTGQDLPTSRRRTGRGPAEVGEEEPPETEAVLLRALTRPPVVLVAVLSVLALVAARGLIGSGRLMEGALLPAPGSAGDLWRSYADSWHGVGLGSASPAWPYVALVALLGTVLAGSASAAVDLALLAAVPLAAATAYVAASRLTTSRWLRVAGAAAFALTPATSGAVAAGRLGTAAAIVALPLAGLAAVRALSPGAALRSSVGLGLLLAVLTALAPAAWPLALLLGLAALAWRRTWAAAVRVVVALVVPLLVLLPWSATLLSSPARFATEPGLPGPDLSQPRLAPWAVLLQHAGGPGGAPGWIGAGLLVAGLAALARRSRRRDVTAGWVLALAGLAVGLAVSRTAVSGPTLDHPVAGWPGFAVAAVAAGLLVAAVRAADGLARPRRSAVRAQPLLVVAVVVALVTPVAGALWWVVRGVEDPLARRDPAVLPAYVVEEANRPAAPRALVVRRGAQGSVSYALLRGSGPVLGDAETGPPGSAYAPLDAVLGDIVAGRGGADVERLVTFGIGFLYLPAPADPDLSDAFDAVTGLARASAPDGAAMWRVDRPVGRARLLPPGATGAATATVLPSQGVEVDAAVPDGAAGRTVALAELADEGWTARLDDVALEPVVLDGWAQGFVLPAGAGRLDVAHRGAQRALQLWLQGGLIVLAVVLALPGVRRDPSTVDDAAEIDPGDVGDGPTGPPRRPRTEGGLPVGGRRARRSAAPSRSVGRAP